MGLLSSKQQLLVNRISQLVINETDLSSSSSDGDKAVHNELNALDIKHLKKFGKQMLKSKKVIDQRFVNLFKVHKAYQNHVKLGFGGFDDEYIYRKPEPIVEQSE